MPRVFHFAKPILPKLSKTVTITTAIDIKAEQHSSSFSSRLRIATMVPNSVALTRTFPRLYSIMSFSSKNLCLSARQTRFLVRGFKSRSYSFFLSSTHGFKEFGSRKTGAGQLGFDCFRVSAVSDGGSRGIGGFGGSGDENSGGKGEGADGNGGRNDWSLLSWYLALLAKYPVFTKAVTSALLTFIGDLICQLAIDHVPSLDVKRTFLFTLLGLVLVGPTLHFWYLCLSNLVKLPGASVSLFSYIYWSFLIYIGDTRRKAFASCTQTSTGVVFCCSCELAAVDTFPISQLSICPTAISGPCCKFHCFGLECDSLIQSSQRDTDKIGIAQCDDRIMS
ncbi:Peroxisomal membrane 22 kDa family protein isoform 3 [Theobroma cacao]|uniref:Peroxisomal membrane 22 kDa family protein isoform 3 n=1 Tax=Theobroma cacao TaxID=3641 RepID=A0A061EVR2_THECC|nr:Peroxisomal membrane 22 kDa family protein isoform 3 [Theobroma cacao]